MFDHVLMHNAARARSWGLGGCKECVICLHLSGRERCERRRARVDWGCPGKGKKEKGEGGKRHESPPQAGKMGQNSL